MWTMSFRVTKIIFKRGGCLTRLLTSLLNCVLGKLLSAGFGCVFMCLCAWRARGITFLRACVFKSLHAYVSVLFACLHTHLLAFLHAYLLSCLHAWHARVLT